MLHSKALLGASTALATMWATSLFAAPAAMDEAAKGPAIEEVIVTAQKRMENVQDVPLSIIAKSGAQLQHAGVNNVQDLQRVVPNLQLVANNQSSGIAIKIRGFGGVSNTAIDPSVAPYIDGVYIPRPGAILASFLDIAGVEVLRGPQGTLFGRNATVGAISLNTNVPSLSRKSGELSAEVGNFSSRRIEAIGNLPVSDSFAIRAAGFAEHSGGYFKNLLDGKTYGERDTIAGRLSAKWALTPTLTWLGRVDHTETTGDGFSRGQVDVTTATPAQLSAYIAALGGRLPTLSVKPSYTYNQKIDALSLSDRQTGVSSDLSWEAPGGFTVRLIDAHRRWNNTQADGDVIATPLDLLNRRGNFRSNSQSHELQIISPKDALLDGRLNYVAGIYYFSEDYQLSEILDLGPEYCGFVIARGRPALLGACNANPLRAASTGLFMQHATSAAIYAQTDFKIVPKLVLTLGARGTTDKKTGSFSQVIGNPGATLLRAAETHPSLKVKDSRPTWRANLTWRAADGVIVFASYSTGYKSGGLNSAGGGAALDASKRIFQAETASEYAVGLKSELFERRLLLNANVYQTDLEGFQERSNDGTGFTIRNGGNVRARGVEVEGQARPSDHLRLDASVAYLDSTYSKNVGAPGLPGCTGAATSCPSIQNLTGRSAPYSPKWQANAAIQYDTPPFWGGRTAQVRGDVNFIDSMITTIDNNPQNIAKSRTLFGGRINMVSAGNSLTLSVFATNIFNKHYFIYTFPHLLGGVFGAQIPGATLMRGTLGEPRRVGISVRKTL